MTTDDFFGSNCYELLKKVPDGKSGDEKVEAEEFNKKLKSITKKLVDLNNRYLLKRACAISNEIIEADRHNKYRFEKDILKLNNRNLMMELEKKFLKNTKISVIYLTNRMRKTKYSWL